MSKKATDDFAESIRRIQESPILQAMRDIERSSLRLQQSLLESPSLRAFRDLQQNSFASQFAELERGSSFRAITELSESPGLKALRELNSQSFAISQSLSSLIDSSAIERAVRPFGETAKLLAQSPIFKAMEDLQNSNSFKAFGKLAETFSSQLVGPLTLGSAYEEVLRTFQEVHSSGGTAALDELEAEIEERVQAAPAGALSREFYLALLFSFIFFLISQISANESEEDIVERIDRLAQVVLMELGDNEQQATSDTFYVVVRAVRLRESPDTSHPTIAILHPNLKVRLVERAGKWIQIEYFDYTKNEYVVGWSAKKYLKILNPKGSRRGL